MNGSSLDYLDQAEGNGYNNGVKPLGQPNAIQQVRQRMIGSLAAPFQNAQSNFGIAANDNVIHIAPQMNGIDAIHSMPGFQEPQAQAVHGLIGRTWDKAKTTALDSVSGGAYSKGKESYANTQSMMNGGFANSNGGGGTLEGLGNTFQDKISSALPDQTQKQSSPTLKDSHLGAPDKNGLRPITDEGKQYIQYYYNNQ